MFDPNANTFDVEEAERLLGMEDEDRDALRLLVAVDLIMAHVGITDEQVTKGYENKLKAHITEASESLRSLVVDE